MPVDADAPRRPESPDVPSPRPLDPGETVRPAAVVLPAVSFDPPLDELAPWLARLDVAEAISVPGADAPVYLTDPDGGIAVTTSGMGKAAAATTVATLHAASGFDASEAYWLSAGIAGAPPRRAVPGSVFVADAVLDWDRKHRWDPDELPPDARDRPHAHVARLSYDPEGSLHRLDDALVERAATAARDVDLVDDPEARELADAYPDAPDDSPRVGVGPTVTSDEFWHGTRVARAVEAHCDAYDLDGYATTQMEDAGTAVALDRHDALGRYLSVRAVANYDRPAPGQTVHESFEGSPATMAAATENAARVGHAVIEALLSDRV